MSGTPTRDGPGAPPPALHTARLVLRPLEPHDLDFLAELLGHPEVMRHYPKPLSRDEARGWMEKQWERYARDGHGFWLVAERETGAPVGQVGLLMQVVDAFGGARYPEVAYLLHRPYWKRGYATEAALAVKDFAFGERAYPSVVSLVRPLNEPSQAVARRLGMRVVAEATHAGMPHLVFSVDAP